MWRQTLPRVREVTWDLTVLRPVLLARVLGPISSRLGFLCSRPPFPGLYPHLPSPEKSTESPEATGCPL